MGSETGAENEKPIHPVWVDSFAIAKHPVTNREYGYFLEATHHKPPLFWQAPQFQQLDQPVVAISWYEAVTYCQWLSEVTGRRYRLPTEAEREKAARGGLAGSEYPWGNELPADHRGGPDAPLDTVGSEGPNGYGLYEMSAGVHEWCADFYDPLYYQLSPYRNPPGPTTGRRRVARGGSWRHHIRFARCAARSSIPPEMQYSDFGFRCAATVS